MTGRRPLIAASMGDPAGIGPEVLLKAACVGDVRDEMDLVIFGDTAAMKRAAHDCDIPFRIVEVAHPEEARSCREPGSICVVPVSSLASDLPKYGQSTPASDAGQVSYVERATEAVRGRLAQALVTAPIHKVAFARAGARWAGHTDMLGEILGVERPVMMLAGPRLKVIPLTQHVPLREVSARITEELVLHTIRVAHATFRDQLAIPRPRISVAGVNPHAGEGGRFGTEEQVAIAPAVLAAREEGINVVGPLSGDSVFRRAHQGEFDVVVGMYHDQALIPLKLLDFDEAVNVTLGLPIIRTSVDHGTAYDIAGQGVASAGSMIAALRMAAHMAARSASPLFSHS